MNKADNHNGNGHRVRRTYSDSQIAEALAMLKGCGGNLSRASGETGVPRKTLERWAKGDSNRVNAPEVAEEMAEMRQQTATSIADRLENLIGQILDVAPGKLGDAPFGQSMTGLAIAVDKMRLLRDQPTQIQGSTDGAFTEMVKEYAAKFNLSLPEAKARIAGNLTNPAAIAALDAAFPPLTSEKEQ